jgi:hypothetical protein
LRVEGLESRVWGVGFMVSGPGCRVWDVGIRVWGAKFRVYYSLGATQLVSLKRASIIALSLALYS